MLIVYPSQGFSQKCPSGQGRVRLRRRSGSDKVTDSERSQGDSDSEQKRTQGHALCATGRGGQVVSADGQQEKHQTKVSGEGTRAGLLQIWKQPRF